MPYICRLYPLEYPITRFEELVPFQAAHAAFGGRKQTNIVVRNGVGTLLRQQYVEEGFVESEQQRAYYLVPGTYVFFNTRYNLCTSKCVTEYWADNDLL